MQAELIPTTQTILKRPELLAPAGNWECAKAAVENGADAIYFGLEKFNARMRAENFTEADLPELMEFLHLRGVKGYVTLNTLVFPQELREAERYLRGIIAAGVDAVIVQDIGICRLIRHLSPDFPIHASTQMTITSEVGVEFAEELGCNLVVLARECSLPEINKIQNRMQYRGATLPLEVFVHGALCVAYSGQCLTSEALGGRSANRGECAQACRMPYELIVDGESIDLGDKRYLLSPQDLAGLSVLPDLVQTGVSCLKIEGRLKAPEYVANVTKVYREALDRLLGELEEQAEQEKTSSSSEETSNSRLSHPLVSNPSPEEIYNLEMAFSRGIYTGWFRGINNQELVHARFGKKRGVYLGEVKGIRNEEVTLKLAVPLKAGDGIVFDCGHPEMKEEGGRVYGVQRKGKETIISFGKGNINWQRVHVGDKLWKTNDPELDKRLRQSYAGEIPQFQRPIDIEVHGEVGKNLVTVTRDEFGYVVLVESEIFLQEAHTKPLTTEKLQEQFGRLGNTPFKLGNLVNHLQGNVILPVSELNRIRREIITKLEAERGKYKPWKLNHDASLKNLLALLDGEMVNNFDLYNHKNKHHLEDAKSLNLIVLVRNLRQLQAAIDTNIRTIYCEFEDIRKYRDAVEMVKGQKSSVSPIPEIFIAPPRITKPGENWILKQIHSHGADGYLIRNYDQLKFFASDRCVGDFSLNIANALTADYFKNKFGLERITASYDLNINQLEDLITSSPPHWYEVTIHQHMPMFHMEHCVFCAFLSDGTDFTNCGRPCEKHEVKLRESRFGSEHILQADVGCRNTVFNATAQTGAEYVQKLINLGLQSFRIEFVNESPEDVAQTIQRYRQLLRGNITGSQLWKELKLQSQLGVTRGTNRAINKGGG
ncbi:MAG: U32 family peptidase [Methylacidiphilales bacterium]|nr:U32 family peptidase [Candidatus Methylacidiphilales bacterium]